MLKLGAIVLAVLLLMGGSGFVGWSWRDSKCDEATAKRDLAAEKSAHEKTKLELATVQSAAAADRRTQQTIERTAKDRQEAIDDLVKQLEEMAAKDAKRRCRVGDDGLRWLRRVAPD